MQNIPRAILPNISIPHDTVKNNRLLYEYGEILTRVSIAVTRACECHANANECQHFSIFVQ